jgi:hypothetical protein
MNPGDDDDEVEMEVRPLAQPHVPRRRSGLAEEPIESGEIIGERRSLIVRSSARVEVVTDPRLARGSSAGPVSNTSVEVSLEPHVAQPAALPAAPRQRRGWLWLIVAVLVAAAAGATFVVKPRAAPVDTDMFGATAALIGTTIDGETRAVQVRAEAVATSSMLRAGIVTDAQTLADMARDKDLVFPVEAGETLEVFQLADGKRTSLLRVPAAAAGLEPPPAGKSALEARIGDALIVTTTAQVTSIEPTIGGEVSLSAPIDLAAIRQRLAGQVEEAVIAGFAIPIVLVKSTGQTGQVVTLPIASTLANANLSLSAIVRPHRASSALPQIRLGLFGLAGLCAVVFLVSLLRR